MEEEILPGGGNKSAASYYDYNLSGDAASQSKDAAIDQDFETLLIYLVGITYSITIIVGIIGNSLVFLTILCQKQMRSTTNILILNLALAELIFIVFCVPFTGFNYVLSVWYFGDILCRVQQYTSNVTCYVFILLLVFMSLDRYLAIRFIGQTSVRNQRNATYAVTLLWLFVLIVNIPHLFLWEEHSYAVSEKENRTVCILRYNVILNDNNPETDLYKSTRLKLQVYYSIFFAFSYVLPFLAILIIYSLIMLILKEAKGKQVSRSKRKVTYMVVLVVVSFIGCWTPLQIVLFLQHVVNIEVDKTFATIMVTSNCIAYLNTCVNPIIYGFANQEFRTAYAATLRCECGSRKYAPVATNQFGASGRRGTLNRPDQFNASLNKKTLEPSQKRKRKRERPQ